MNHERNILRRRQSRREKPLSRPVRAFTLVEMLLVLVLISILTGAAVVSLSGKQDQYALKVSTDDLAAAIGYAATQAHLTQQSYRVSFDPQRESYQVLVRPDSTANEYVPADGLAGSLRHLVHGVQVVSIHDENDPTKQSIEALDFGLGTNFYGLIRLQNRLEQSATIQVLAQTQEVCIVR